MRLIDADLLLPQIGNRYDEKKDIVPDNLAEGFHTTGIWEKRKQEVMGMQSRL